MLVQLDECHEARVWSDKALEIFRNNGELLAAKSQACMRLKDKQAALACSDASLQVPGSSPWRWIARGEVLLATGQKHAEDCFQKALLEPAADWFDRVVIGRIYLYYRRASNALYHIQAALDADAANGYVWFEKGHCEGALRLVAAAAESYERCLELRPDYREAAVARDSLASPSPFGRLWSLIHRRRR
jgi:tetratricopeptide (TPR) repeat protein